MAEFDPKNYGSKKSKVYSAAPSAGTATVKKDTAASAAVSDYTGGGETFSPNRYGSKKSKLYSADVKTPQTTQKKSTGGLFEKILQTIGAGVQGAASGFAEVVGQATPTTGDQHMGQFSGFGDLGRAVRENRETGADISESVRRMEQERSEKRKAHQQKIYDAATELAERSDELREQAKQGAGKVGGFLVDLGATGTQVAGDALANALLPGSGMAMMATRVYGQSAGDARREGKTEGQQIAAGLKGAAIETLTEKLFGGLAKAYGAGTADAVVEKIADKLTKSDAGKRAATWLINSGGEGVEEVLSDILNPLADRALGLDDGEGRILTADDAAQMGYDFLLGAAMGALGGAGQLRAARNAQNGDSGPQSAAQGTAEAPGARVDRAGQSAAERPTGANAAIKETVPAAADVEPMQTQESSPVQGAGNGRQQVDAPLAPLGVSATQESPSSIPQSAAKYKGLDELLGKAKSGRMSSADVTDRISTAEEMERLTKELESGAYGMDAADSLYRIKPEEHIDRRERSTVGDRRVKAFQFDHPELHNYFVDAAKRLRYDMDNGQRGGEVYQVPDRDGDWRPRYLRTKRHTTDAVAKLKDDDHLTYDQIYKALEDIIADKGQENYAAAKRVELVLDKMLSEGYTGSDGTYQPDPDYLRRKAAISGARTTAADVDAAESERTWTQRLQDAENGFFEGQTSAERARQDAETALPEDWERRYDGQEPPAMPAATEGGSSPFPAGGKDGLGGADRGSLNSEYDELQARSSRFHEAGNNAYRPVDVPKTDFDGRPVSQTASTVMGAEAIPDDMIPEIEQMVADGKLSYKTFSDKKALTRAEHTIRANGFDGAMEKYRAAVRRGTVGKDVEAIGQLLLENAANARDGKAMAELLMLYQQSGTNVGQAMQARTMFRKLSPTAQLYGVQKAVDDINENTRRRIKRLRGDAANVPVEEWMNKTGELLADQLKKQAQPNAQQAKTVAQTVLSDLRQFAQQKIAKAEVGAKKRTDMERIYDLFHNREKYQEAWDAAKRTVAEKYGNNAAVMEALDEWYNSTIDYTDIFTKAVTGQTDVKVDDALITKFLEQTDQAGRDAVLGEIYQNVADQMPATWYEKWNAWRYLSMLANPRTHVRNMVGNVFFQPLRWTKDRIAGVVEAGMQKAGYDVERTKSFSLAGKELYRAAWADFDNVAKEMSGNRYSDTRGEIQDRRAMLDSVWRVKTPWLEKLRKFNGDALTAEDTLAKRVTYADALAGYLKANGVTAEQMTDGSADADVLTKGREYAAQEAMKATFNDKNAVSDAVTRAARAAGPLGEAVLPFKRTPANILVRGVEYSPVGLAKGIADLGFRVQDGKVTAAQAIDEIASGLTGSALLALGALLASKGVVTGGGDDDEDQRWWNNLLGHQDYALELPDGTSVKLDWLAPEALPFFMGVNLSNSVGEDGWTAESVVGMLRSIADPMLEMSMLQSLNDMLEDKKYEEGSGLEKLVTSAITSYFSQGVPTIGGQIKRTLEDKRMRPYVDKNSDVLTKGVQQLLGKLSGKLPGVDVNRIPYIDEWGQEEYTGDVLTRLINNTLNPAYVSKVEMDSVEKELSRLGRAVGSGVYPDRADQYFEVDGSKVYLDGDQYTAYAKALGQKRHELLEDAFKLDGYKAMSDVERAALVSTMYEYANARAKNQVVPAYELTSKMQKYADVEAAGMTPAEWYVMKKAADTDGSGGTSQKEAQAALDKTGLTEREKAALWPLFNRGWTKNPYK